MHKILIKGYFKNTDLNKKINYDNLGYLLGNIITFENNKTKLKLIDKNLSVKFIKEDNNSKLEYEFILNKETTGKYKLKKDNLLINIPIYTTLIEKKAKSIKIEYDLLDDIGSGKNIIYIEYEVIN